MISNPKQATAAFAAAQPKNLDVTKALGIVVLLSATPLTGAALGANAASPGTYDLVAAANRTGDSHKYAAKRDGYAIGVTIAVPVLSTRFRIARRMIRDHVDHFFLRGASQI